MHARLAVPTLTLALAGLLWLVMGQAAVVNYDTLYGLLWGKELLHGDLPDMTVPGAPTPHPLLTLAGLLLAPILGSASPAALSLLAYLGYVATASCVVLLGLVARRSVGLATGIVAGIFLVTREPVLSYGLRVYIDLPYLALLLGALTIELSRPRAGTPVLVLLLLAGLLRPEAWLLSIAYLAWLAFGDEFPGRRTQVVWLVLAAGGPVLWGLTDLLLTGDVLFSFRGTRAGTERLERPTGLSGLVNVAPRRIGEILRWEVLLGAIAGTVLLLRPSATKGRVVVGATVAVAVAFALVGLGGLPVIVRYLLPIGAFGCLACAYVLTGWRSDPSIPIGRVWVVGAAALLVGVVLLAPAQAQRLDRLQASLSEQQRIITELEALSHEIPCGPIVVPNRRAVPLMALWTDRPARSIITAQDQPIPPTGTYLYPATIDDADAFILDARDRDRAIPPPPPGYEPEDRTTSWILAANCG